MKIFKSRIFMFVLGALIFSGIAVYAEEALRAQDILYSNSKDSNIASVKDALDKLYESNSNSSFCIKISGDSTTPGSEYICDPGDGIYRTFYVLSVDGDDVRLIMDRNITEAANQHKMAATTALNYFTTGAGATYASSWTNVKSITLPTATEIAAVNGNTSWNPKNDSLNGFTISQSYPWLYSYLYYCLTEGCNVNKSLSDGTMEGYWTSTVTASSGYYWYVYRQRKMAFSNDNAGVRPVITVSKDNLK